MLLCAGSSTSGSCSLCQSGTYWSGLGDDLLPHLCSPLCTSFLPSLLCTTLLYLLFFICSCRALCELLAPTCFVSLPTKVNIYFTAESVLYPVRSVPYVQVPVFTLNWLLAGAESSGSCEQCLPGDYSIAEGDMGRVHRFWQLFVAHLVCLSDEQADRNNIPPRTLNAMFESF